MGRAYSDDLRGRAAALVAAGRSCREVAGLFGVSVASAVRWSQRLRGTGSAGARPPGRKQPRSLAGERDWLLARLAAEPDVTLRRLVAELGQKGVNTSYGSVWRIVRETGVTFKKEGAVRDRTGSVGGCPKARAVAQVPGSHRA